MKALLKSIVIGLSFSAGLQAMDREELNPGLYPEEVHFEILKQSATDLIPVLGSEVSFDAVFGRLRLVCKYWQAIIDKKIDPGKNEATWKQKKKDFWVEFLAFVYGGDCRQFLRGALRYTPNLSELGKYTDLLVVDLEKPFSGEFNLSTCGNIVRKPRSFSNEGYLSELGYVNQNFSIRTGYRKEKIKESENKVEIWFTPRFIVNRESSIASHLASVLPEWNDAVVSIGIFWNFGDWDDFGWYNYTIPSNIDSFSKNDLLKLYRMCQHHGENRTESPFQSGSVTIMEHLKFVFTKD